VDMQMNRSGAHQSILTSEPDGTEPSRKANAHFPDG
jgi:hypothetical protein